MSALHRAVLVACVVAPLAGAGVYLHSRDEARVIQPSSTSQVRTLQVPIGFEINRGQVDARVDYLARGPGYSLFLTASEAVFRLVPSAQASQSTVLRLSLIGANKAPVAQGEAKQEGVSHYIHGAQSRTAERFGKVRYTGVYPGIDVVYYGNQRELEYDFIVAPGADPKAIGLRFGGTHAVKLDASGNLVLSTDGGDVVQHKPIAYQTIDGQRRSVDSHYRVRADNSVAFEIGAYDRTQALVIDPVVVYRKSIDGSSQDMGYAVAVDEAGNAYVTGFTESLDFPVTENAPQPHRPGDFDAYVAKVDTAGNAFVYSTYLGGNGRDTGAGLAVAPDGTVVVTGETASTDFPLVNQVRSTLGGSQDGFVARLSADGSTLLHSTYLGGAGIDSSVKVATDADGNAYVVGQTRSSDFPTTHDVVTPIFVPSIRGFVTKFDHDGAIVYSTFMPSSLTAVAVDREGNAYTGGYDNTVRKLSPAADAVLLSKTISGSESIYDIALDDDGFVYALGRDFARTVPMVNTELTKYSGHYACKIDPAFTAFVYCAYVGEPEDAGGNMTSASWKMAVDKDGGVVVAGSIMYFAPNGNQQVEGVVQRLLPSGRNQRAATWLGPSRAGDVWQSASDIALDSDGNAYAAGTARDSMEWHAFVTRVTPADWKIVGAGDRDGDGRADLFWHNRGLQRMDWWRMQGVSRVGVGTAPIAMQYSVLALADFNGDGRTDVLWRDQAKTRLWLWQAEADGTYSIHFVADHPQKGWEVAGAGDVDGDGRADILLHNRELEALDWWLMDGPTLRFVGSQFVPSQYSIASIADFSGDGRADIVWQDDARTTLWMWRPDVSDFAIDFVAAYPPAGWKIVGAGDLDGDHRADLLWHNVSLQQLDWWRMQGAARIGMGSKFIPYMYRVDAVGDFDGDHRADIAWRDDDRSTLWMWRAMPTEFVVQSLGDHPQGL